MRAPKETKEEFCGACLAAPLALAGIGTAGVGAGKGGHKKIKTIMLWVGVGITILSILITIYFLTKCKSCR
jgi:hypothetical protein